MFPVPGRPWNPPYQPGPGLDAQPVQNWAAGAGVDAVLEKDTDTLPYLFPNGISKEAIASNQTLNMRELPISLQLIDWNHWLPKVHPKDAWGTAFTNSVLNKEDAYIRSYLSGASSNILTASGIKTQFGYFEFLTQQFGGGLVFPGGQHSSLLLAQNEGLYSNAQWHAVKEWGLMQEFGLEGHGSDFYGAKAEGERQWLSSTAFFSSPAMVKVPEAGTARNTLERQHYLQLPQRIVVPSAAHSKCR